MKEHHLLLRTLATLLVLGAGLWVSIYPQTAWSDDRSLLREFGREPLVFILFDTSGSMHWSPRCTQEQFDAGDCTHLCPTGDCFVPLNSDDPNSKFYQAKEALHQVLETVNDVHFGFGTYNQDALRVRTKHWIYEAMADGPTIRGYGSFPAAGSEEVFGRQWNCDTGSGDNNIGCYSTWPADLDDPWELARVRRLPKLGDDLSATRTFYVDNGPDVFRIRYRAEDSRQSLPDNVIDVRVIVARCNNPSDGCNSSGEYTVTGNQVIPFQLKEEFLAWDLRVNRSAQKEGFFSQSQSSDARAGNTCAGWDPNDDSNSDDYDDYLVRWPTDTSDPRGPLFYPGDVLPIDWNENNNQSILHRLAPNRVLDPAAVPDFRTAPYFQHHPTGQVLHLANESARPLVAFGATPLGNSLQAFRTWWAGCAQGSCADDVGWSDIAASEDPGWGCRKKYLLVLTDGDETCGGADACTGASVLFDQEGIRTFVVAFGVEEGSGNKLACMASNGGTGQPVFPQNKNELVEELSKILAEIREEARTFASAAVPSVQEEVADKIYLAQFTPLNSESFWDGHLDAYLKPLPLTEDNRPDRDRACGGSRESGCHLWDAGEILKIQAPTRAAVDSGSFKLGLGTDQRRVFYAMDNLTDAVGNQSQLRLFKPPASVPAVGSIDLEWLDLWMGMGITFDPNDSISITDAQTRSEQVIKDVLAIKTATILASDGMLEDIDYILGDIFHSDLAVFEHPENFRFFAADAHGNRAFSSKHRRRRRMLVAGTNDGQLHFFDIGIWNQDENKYTDGTGLELFSYIPRMVLPVLRDQTEGSRHIFSVDGPPLIDDVFIDPAHAGVPDPDQREWRTVLVAGLREASSRDGGGRVGDFVSGYYALDLTQPDKLKQDSEGQTIPTTDDLVPTCLDLDNRNVTDCGPVPFPAELWEFTDSYQGIQVDEDANHTPDLGETWSVPTIGRIRVLEDFEQGERWVAIFGGGLDPVQKTNPQRGNFVYMVDIETGRAIYKRRLDSDFRRASVPSAVAAVDTDLDTYLDTLYVGTTAGLFYKVDISLPGTLEDVLVTDYSTVPARQIAAERITDTAWDPFPIFDTQGKPIYFAPTVLFIQTLNRFALAFGTGDRENLWSVTNQEGRFYLVLDDAFTASQVSQGSLPKLESQYQEILPDGAVVSLDDPQAFQENFILNPGPGLERGWFMRLEPDERLIAPAFGLAGIVSFSSFMPLSVVDAGGDEGVCGRTGESRLFVVLAGSGNAALNWDGQQTRYRLVPDFVTSPYVEQAATKNPATDERHSEQLEQYQVDLMEVLKGLFPKGTRFGNFWISISAIRSDTGYVRYGTIPVGIYEWNWKEH